MKQVAALIAEVLTAIPQGEAKLAEAEAAVRRKVGTLTERFPLYSWKFAHTPA